MRVLHLLHSLRRGGLERVVVSVANGLSRRGLPQGVCCLHAAGPLIESLDAEVDAFVLDAKPNSVSLPFRLWRAYRAFGPEVIHTVDFSSWPDATAAAMLGPRVRRMHTFHGFLSRPAWRYRLMGRVLAGRTHRLCAVSADLAATVAETYGVRSERIAVLPNGVDVDFFDPGRFAAARAELGIPPRRFVCVTVASLTSAKNPLMLVDVARRVGPEVHFVWVGDGPLRGALEEQIGRCELTGAFTLAGQLDDVRPWLAAADVFILPSDTEAAPLSVLEAMAMQVPVVATRAGTVGALLSATQTGVLVEPGDAVAMARAVEGLRASPGHRRVMGVRGRSAVVERYSMEHMLDAYQRAFETLCTSATDAGRPSTVPVGGA